MKPAATLSLQLSPTDTSRLTTLFGAGVGVVTESGIPLVDFLCNQLGIDHDYIDQRVQTIFVNSRAVDRVEEVRLDADDVIALSAAMPGLVGATLRKGGILAGFRQTISHTGGGAQAAGHQKALVILKLFNLVARDLAAQLLRKGIWVNGRRIAQWLQGPNAPALSGPAALNWNGRPVTADQVTGIEWPDDWVELRVEVGGRPLLFNFI